jgi:hypothetical protein
MFCTDWEDFQAKLLHNSTQVFILSLYICGNLIYAYEELKCPTDTCEGE